MIGTRTFHLLHISLQDFNMSLFKERAVNAKKLISLENTIIALNKQLQQAREMMSQAKDMSTSEEEVQALRDENAKLKEELEKLKASAQPVEKKPARRGRKKAQPSSEES